MSDKYRVLLVEDEKNQLEGLLKIIERSPALMNLIEKVESRMVNPEEGAGEVAKEIANQPSKCSKWNIIIADLFMPTLAKGGLLIAYELIPCFEKDPDFPVKLILISNKEAAGGELREFLPKYKDWLTWKPKPSINSHDALRDDLYPEGLWVYEIGEAIQKLNKINMEDGLNEIELSGKMAVVKSWLDLAANTNDTVLLLGEPGIGKKVFANYIHKKSKFKEKPFETVDCGEITTPILFESNLFGHMPGAFRGADSIKKGVFEKAINGIVFLDEIGNLPKKIQPKLLRILEPKTREFTVMNGETKKFEGKVICATSKNLKEMVDTGKFSKDLHTRISNPYSIKLPPLRERREDIIPLAKFLIDEECKKENLKMRKLSKDAEKVLEDYDWCEGNGRELRNSIIRAIMLSGRAGRKKIVPQDFPDILRAMETTAPSKLPYSLINEKELERLVNYPPDEFVLKMSMFRDDVLRAKLDEQAIKDKIVNGIRKLLTREKTITKVANLMGFTKSKYFYEWLGKWGLIIRDI